MFTGIIEGVATITSVRRVTAGLQISIDLGERAKGLERGASVAVNGVCLTVTRLDGTTATFDAVAETVGRTNLAELQPGHGVNVERSLRVGSAIDGHFVQGHVDGMARVSRIETGGGEWKLWCEPPAELMRFMVVKGSVALDGISLTLVDVTAREISVAVIPTTLDLTTLGQRKVGDRINVETDMIARIVIRQLELAGAGESDSSAPERGGVTMQQLIDQGFV